MRSGVEKLLVIYFCNSIDVRTGLSSQAYGKQHHEVPGGVLTTEH